MPEKCQLLLHMKHVLSKILPFCANYGKSAWTKKKTFKEKSFHVILHSIAGFLKVSKITNHLILRLWFSLLNRLGETVENWGMHEWAVVLCHAALILSNRPWWMSRPLERRHNELPLDLVIVAGLSENLNASTVGNLLSCNSSWSLGLSFF